MITRGTFSALLTPGLRKVYVETGKERPYEYSQVMNVQDMEWNPVTDRQISGLASVPEKQEGSQFGLDQPILGGTRAYTATPYGLAVEITWEMWRDELYGVMEEMIREEARAARNREEIEGWRILNNAFAAGNNGFDGVTLCNTAHVGLDGVSRANRPAVEIGFSVTGLQNSITRFHNMKNERNLPMLLRPKMAVVDPSNLFAAREILGSSGKPYTADNEINALVPESLGWMVSHYKTTAAHWHLVAQKGQHDLNVMFRDRAIFDSFDDPWTKNAIFTVYLRMVSGFGSWRGVDGSTG